MKSFYPARIAMIAMMLSFSSLAKPVLGNSILGACFEFLDTKIRKKVHLRKISSGPNGKVYKWCYQGHACVVVRLNPKFARNVYLNTRDSDIEWFFYQNSYDYVSIDSKAFPGSNTPFINCHSSACIVNRIPGFDKMLWINGDTFGREQSDLDVILNLFFEKLESISPGQQLDPRLAPGDFISFVGRDNSHIHSGVLVESPWGAERLWMQSKFGIHKMYATPIDVTLDYYRSESGRDIKRIEIWRRKWH